MSRFDAEAFFDYCENLLKDKISDKVAEINAEKGDSLLIAPNDRQFITDFTEQILNEDIFFYCTMLPAENVASNGPFVSTELKMMVYVAFIDTDGGEKSRKKGFRYTRAISEIYQNAFDNLAEVSNIEIIQHIPESAQFQNESEWYKLGGVEIKGTITT